MKKKINLIVLLFLLLARAVAEENQKALLYAEPIKSSINIDGKLDEACWNNARWYNKFLIKDSDSSSTSKTKVAVFYDDDFIYLGIYCDEPDISTIETKKASRDNASICRTDSIEIMLDPTLSNDEYFHFIINASGAVLDRMCTQGGWIGDMKWDADMETASFIGKNFWSCEVAMPFYCLAPWKKFKNIWGINICRQKRNPREFSSVAKNGTFNIATNFAELENLNVDFSTFFYKISAPVFNMEIKAGNLNFSLTTLVTNNTGKDSSVLFEAWLISPKDKVRSNIQEIILRSGKTTHCKTKVFSLKENGLYKYGIRILNPRNKKTLAILEGTKFIEFTPMTVKLKTPWYRNSIFETQNIKSVEMDVMINLSNEEMENKKLQTGIYIKGSQKPLQYIEIAKLQKINNISFSSEKLPFGNLEIRSILFNADGKIISETKYPLLKLKYKKGEVWLDRNKKWNIEGKPFFAIGAWAKQRDYIPEYNLFTTNLPGKAKFLDKGLQEVLKYKCKSFRHKNLLTSKEADICRNYIRKAKNNPNLFAYSISDEPECSSICPETLEKVYKIVRDEDPYHPVMVSNDSIQGVKDYAKCMEINGLHAYPPILKKYNVNNLSKTISFMEESKKIFEKKNIQQTIFYMRQGFSFADFGRTNNRIPNYLEGRNQDLLAVICGADGLIQFPRAVSHYLETKIGGPYIAKEMQLLSPVFLAPSSNIIPKTSHKETKMLLKNLNGNLYLLACNASMQNRKITLTIPGIKKMTNSLNVISEGRIIQLNGDSFEDEFSPFEVHIYTNADISQNMPTVKEISEKIARANEARRKKGNLAFQMFEGDGVKVSASSNDVRYKTIPDMCLWHVVDGIIDTDNDDYKWLAWHDETPNIYPDWLEIQLPEARRIDRIVVYPFNESLRDYSVQLFSDGKWKDVDKVSAQKSKMIEHKFSPVLTDRIRLWITGANGPHSEITEVEIYADRESAQEKTDRK